jgi:hypothetical protein
LYALAEAVLGVYGIASLDLLDFLGTTTAGVSYGWAAVYSALFLLVPTTLMGGTLPVILKIYNQFVGRYLESLSTLYCVNTLGAAFGAFICAYP